MVSGLLGSGPHGISFALVSVLGGWRATGSFLEDILMVWKSLLGGSWSIYSFPCLFDENEPVGQ